MPELNQLSQLIAISEAGTFSKAAEAVHISQPALTRSIQRLEAELNVTLFDREKNKVHLNKTGELAVQYARRVLDDVNQMTQNLQAFERSQRTISIGSCAPAPLAELLVTLPERFIGMNLSSELLCPELLLPRLKENIYQVVVINTPVEEPGIICREFCTEQLYLTVPPAHPLATKKEGIYADELAGETMLLYHNLGIWQNFHNTKMSQTEFIVQERDDAFDALLRTSALPAFATNLTLKRLHRGDHRVVIPFLDPEAKITFYCCVRKENQSYLP